MFCICSITCFGGALRDKITFFQERSPPESIRKRICRRTLLFTTIPHSKKRPLFSWNRFVPLIKSVQIPEGRWNPSRRGTEENYIFNGGAWTAPWAERSDCLRTGYQRAFWCGRCPGQAQSDKEELWKMVNYIESLSLKKPLKFLIILVEKFILK